MERNFNANFSSNKSYTKVHFIIINIIMIFAIVSDFQQGFWHEIKPHVPWHCFPSITARTVF